MNNPMHKKIKKLRIIVQFIPQFPNFRYHASIWEYMDRLQLFQSNIFMLHKITINCPSLINKIYFLIID